ncbi:ATP-binding protein [Paenibacillus hunanensis]|uniref:ATP-binding response regulator n=1 Tax=Paenibacillus hunanensis TaxID=539262 RepID=UPI00202652B9|nr:ATP-binding protein [Paenibacillus hunanensis]MCL9661783.1 ATP-binding protein [Paenibacillus hunanensis]
MEKLNEYKWNEMIQKQNEMEQELRQLQQQLASEQQEREQAEQSAENKARFIAMLSHEIRTPMNGILSMSDLLRNTSLDEEQQGYLHVLHTSSESLMTLVNNLLDIGKIEAGKMKLARDPFDLINTMEDLTYALAPRAFEKGVQVHLNVHSDIPLFVIGDALKVRQIIMNLLQNAIKFTKKGDISVSLFMLPNDDLDRLTVKVSVEDTGIGIPPERLNDIFKMYEQMHEQSEHMHQGTGLGLAICKQLTELMGGTIQAESLHGVGTSVSITLEFERYTDLPSIPFKDNVLHDLRILLLEHNAICRGLIHDMLVEWGAQVTIADDMDERFFDELYHHDYDLVLVDLDMLDRERWIRERTKIQKQQLFLLAPLGEKVEGEFRDTFETVITKPIRKIHLLNSILALQQGHR